MCKFRKCSEWSYKVFYKSQKKEVKYIKKLFTSMTITFSFLQVVSASFSVKAFHTCKYFSINLITTQSVLSETSFVYL